MSVWQLTSGFCNLHEVYSNVQSKPLIYDVVTY